MRAAANNVATYVTAGPRNRDAHIDRRRSVYRSRSAAGRFVLPVAGASGVRYAVDAATGTVKAKSYISYKRGEGTKGLYAFPEK